MFIIVTLMCAMLRNFDFLERIIGLNLENNQKTFQEVRNRIFGKILIEHNCLKPTNKAYKGDFSLRGSMSRSL